MFDINFIKERLQGFSGVKAMLHHGDTLVVDIEGAAAQLVLSHGDLMVTGESISTYRYLDTASAVAKAFAVVRAIAVRQLTMAEILQPDAELDDLLARQVA